MKRFLCLLLLGSSILATLEWERQHRKSRRRETVSAPAVVPDGVPPQAQEPIGWVFGRLIGVPGAERPLLGGKGLANEGLTPPPPTTDHFRR